MPNILDTIQVSGASYDLKDKNAPSVSSLTQSEYDNLPATAKTSNTFFVITDAQAGDLTNYYTKTETDNAITAATSTKQDTLVSGTNIKTINNTSLLGSGNIDIQGGGGKAIEAGRGITVTTGETADTVSFNLPISAGTGVYSIAGGNVNGEFINIASNRAAFAFGVTCSAVTQTSFSVGYSNLASGGASAQGNFAQGYMTRASGNRCHSEGLGTSATSDASHSEGYNTTASGNYSHSEGEEVKATNVAEHSQGRYNVSNKANTTWGDSGNTLFSVGNGTADNARHNAFEIRQNGDIYCSDGTNDVKLQDTITATAANTTALGGLKLVKLTQSAYDALSPNYDSNTLYVIVN